ncbi:U4/U6 small nuclear ribonucleoprotein Prp31 homolog [Zingiber officinale]|uniref:U4/U6 small nuclear ribonucleoprotein Prp31 homolog n=1 Tax=Zingiber officinale TaxID=94328 RepID=UPI001C4BD084|nr:U4/U6 small nuclear ribonucleoprotein Prp31 homolog [Zingiber officinale]
MAVAETGRAEKRTSSCEKEENCSGVCEEENCSIVKEKKESRADMRGAGEKRRKSAIIGSVVAAKLMGIAGGLSELAKMPACNVQLLGAKKKALAGFSTATSQFRVGYLEQAEIFQSTPPLRTHACWLLASKSTLAARVDSTRGDPTGKAGRNLRDEILKKIEKWQEPPPAK